MEMQELLGFLSVWEALRVVQAHRAAGGKRRRKGKSSQGKFFPLSLCPVITHTHTEAYVNSHVGSEKQIEIRGVIAGQRSDDKRKGETESGCQRKKEERGERSFADSPR